jgi:hypothetical protein
MAGGVAGGPQLTEKERIDMKETLKKIMEKPIFIQQAPEESFSAKKPHSRFDPSQSYNN